MPHTNRARRAHQYRTIENNSNNNNDNKDKASQGDRRFHKRPNEDSNALERYADGGDGRAERSGGVATGGGDAAGRISGGGGGRFARGPRRGRGAGGDGDGGRGVPKGGKKGTPSAKNQIRGLKRLLNKPGIDDDQRLAVKEQVDALESKVSERERQERERTLAIKYHKAKFFDRRKALRRLAQIHRKLQGDIGQTGRLELERKREANETDLKYVLYFPKGKKYVALGKGKDGPPRARRSYERLLQEALKRGEAAGWAEFQDNLDKFVTGNGNPRGGGVVPGEGGGEGGKRKRGIEALPVVAQSTAWEDESSSDEEGGVDEDAAGESGSKADAEESRAETVSKRKPKANGAANADGQGMEGGAPDSVLSGETTNNNNRRDTGAAEKVEVDGLDGAEGSLSGVADGEEGGDDSSGIELGGSDGFGAAASDEEDDYSLAEARLFWATGGVKGEKGVGAKRGLANGSSANQGDEEIAADSDGDDGDLDSDGGGGDEESAGAKSKRTGREREKRSQDRDAVGSTGDEDDSDDSAESGDSESDDAEHDMDKDGSDRDGVGDEGSPSKAKALEGNAGKGDGDEDDSDSGDDIPNLNDDFFLEEKGSDIEADDKPKPARNANSNSPRENGQNRRGGKGGGDRGRGRGGRYSGRSQSRGRGTGRGGRGNRADGGWSRGGTGGGGLDKPNGVSRGGGARRAWVPHGRGGGGPRGGFAGTGGRRGRGGGREMGEGGRGRGGGRVGVGVRPATSGAIAAGSSDGARPNKKIRFGDD